MPRRPTRTVPTVLVPGDPGPDAADGSWLPWLAEQLATQDRAVRRPRLPADAELETWLSALRAGLDGLPDDGFDVVAHSLGAVLWLHHTVSSSDAPRPARVVLVAPVSALDPEPVGFLPPPLDIDAVRRAADGTVLVGGDADPHCPEGIAAAYGRPLKMPTTIISGGQHLDAAAGYGPWPAMLDWCGRDNLAFIG